MPLLNLYIQFSLFVDTIRPESRPRNYFLRFKKAIYNPIIVFQALSFSYLFAVLFRIGKKANHIIP